MHVCVCGTMYVYICIFLILILFHFICRGKDDLTSEEAAFRVHYGRLGEIRSLLGRKVPFVTLTSTIKKDSLQAIMDDLGMADCAVVVGNPNRANIRYAVIKVENSMYSNFHWLIEDLRVNGVEASRHLIFCRQKEQAYELFEIFLKCLGYKSYHGLNEEGGNDYRNRIFAMYHSKTDTEIQSFIRDSFSVPNGTVRILFATTAFSMGVNTQGVYNVIHYGPPNDTDEYVQETGRAGRDYSTQSHALLLRYKHALNSNKIYSQMKGYVRNEQTCRRVYLLKEFWEDILPGTPMHKCCDICSKQCRCYCTCNDASNCSCPGSCPTEEHSSTAENMIRGSFGVQSVVWQNEEIVHTINEDQRSALFAGLMNYRYSLVTQLPEDKLITGMDIATGFSISLIHDICNHMEYIGHPDTLRAHFNFFSNTHLQATWDILCTIIESEDNESSPPTDDDDDASDIDISSHKVVVLTTSSSDEEEYDGEQL